jgi:uncharacterized protein (TIGR02996 family)
MMLDPTLLAAVLDDPGNDELRLVCADWLEEHGELDHSEFIRVQCELAAMLKPPTPKIQFERGQKRINQQWGPTEDFVDALNDDKRELRLRQREREVGLAARREWLAFIDQRLTMGASWEFCRGFVAVVRCRLADWIGGECRKCNGFDGRGKLMVCGACHGTGRIPGHGPAICAAQPVERVEVNGYQFPEAFPAGLKTRFPAGMYTYEKDAIDDLSDALLLWAHQKNAAGKTAVGAG